MPHYTTQYPGHNNNNNKNNKTTTIIDHRSGKVKSHNALPKVNQNTL